MPTAKSAPSYDTAGILKTAGITQSWATAVYKKSYKLCKHTVASMFIDKIRVMEPNTFPSGETREKFEKKLAEDIAEVSQEFNVQLKRSELTQIEIIYALAEALNLDDIEIGYVLLTANF
jgi:predicted house-cleaning noncanonical NTP pyrophosphatase (MazG superfamily)